MARLIDADACIAKIKEYYCTGCDNYKGVRCRACTYDDAMNIIDSMPTVNEWIPVKVRPLTEEEKESYADEEYEFIYDCPLPNDSQEVLITTKYGVEKTTFYTDCGCYFENYEDEDDVIAWMPLPDKYEKEVK